MDSNVFQLIDGVTNPTDMAQSQQERFQHFVLYSTTMEQLYPLFWVLLFFRKAYIQVILGAHNIRELEPTQIVVTSTNIIVHPDFNPSNYNNDIGLVRFPNAIVFNSHIQSVTLPSAASGSFVDFEGVLTGWGRLSDSDTGIASNLHAVDVIVMANFWCSRSYGTDVVIDSTLCTSGVGKQASDFFIMVFCILPDIFKK